MQTQESGKFGVECMHLTTRLEVGSRRLWIHIGIVHNAQNKFENFQQIRQKQITGSNNTILSSGHISQNNNIRKSNKMPNTELFSSTNYLHWINPCNVRLTQGIKRRCESIKTTWFEVVDYWELGLPMQRYF